MVTLRTCLSAVVLLSVVANHAECFLAPSLMGQGVRTWHGESCPRASAHAGASALRCAANGLGDGEHLLQGLPTVDRRGVLGGAVLGGMTWALAEPAVADGLDNLKYKLQDGEIRNVIITGCNSGIGRDAAAKLVAGGYNVILACRTMNKSIETRDSILEEVSKVEGMQRKPTVTAMECDLASFKSIRTFASAVINMSIPIDILALNAGLSLATSAKPPPPRTEDGFELTVGTNHMGHFLLCNLLIREMAKNKRGARIVVTASQVHDPASPGGNVGSKASLGGMMGLQKGGQWEMVDGGPFDGDKAYKDSKLCNVLFTKELAKRLNATAAYRGVSVNCFSPGLITKSGLFRNQGNVFVPVFDFAVNNIFKVGETVSFGGDCLLTMACDKQLKGVSGAFWSNSKPGKHTFEPVGISVEAQDGAKAKKLWALSVRETKLKSSESPFAS